MGFLKRLLGDRSTAPTHPAPVMPAPPTPRVISGDDTFHPSSAKPVAELKMLPANVKAGWAQSREWRTWEPPGGLVVGESHHVDGIAPHVGPPRDGGYCIPVEVTFQRQPDNPVDPHAIVAVVDGRVVGYLDKDRAARWSPGLDAAGVTAFSLPGVILGGFLGPDGQPSTRTSYAFGVFVWSTKRLTPAPALRTSAIAFHWPPGSEAERLPRPGVP